MLLLFQCHLHPYVSHYLCFLFRSHYNPNVFLFNSFGCLDGTVTEPDMNASFCPEHKAPMVLFLDRVYGIDDQSFLLHLLEVGFLPDLRASASLDSVRVLCGEKQRKVADINLSCFV